MPQPARFSFAPLPTTAVPQLVSREIVVAILTSPHTYESADQFAKRLGVGNRHRLNRLLRRDGFRSYRELAAFTRILAMRDAAQAHHCSLCAEVIREGFDPAWAYRTFRRITGLSWSRVKALSHDELVALVIGGVIVTPTSP